MELDGGVRAGWGYCLDCKVHISSNKCHVAQMCHMSCDKKGHVSVRWVSVMWWCNVMWMSLDNNVSSEWHMSVKWQTCVQWVLDESCDDVVLCECHLTTCPVSDICLSLDNNESSEWHMSVTWQQCVQWVLDECHVTAMSSWKAHTHYIRTYVVTVPVHAVPGKTHWCTVIPPHDHYNQTCNNET